MVDTSVAVSIVVDESSSMFYLLEDTAKALIALTVSMDSIGATSMVSGFTTRAWGHRIAVPNSYGKDYHRQNAVKHNVYKTWRERLTSKVKDHLASIEATGSTPMADGIQFGLDELTKRQEANRIMFVLTDGQPDYGHGPVIRRQLRLAREAGIHVIGIGLKHREVREVFPDHIVVTDMSVLADTLVTKLDEMISGIGDQVRGRRMKSTG